MIYKTSLSDVIKIFMTVTIMTLQDTNRFHSTSTVKKCKHIFLQSFSIKFSENTYVSLLTKNSRGITNPSIL